MPSGARDDQCHVVRFRPYGSTELAQTIVDSAEPDPERPWTSLQSLLDRAHGPYSGPFADHLTGRGVPTIEVIMGVDALIDAWELEFGAIGEGVPRAVGYALAAIERFRPEVVIDHNFRVTSPDFVATLRRRSPGVRVIGSVGTAKRLHLGLLCDAIATPYPHLAALYRSAGVRRVRVVHHSFDPTVLTDLASPTATGVPVTDRAAVFAGSVGAPGLGRRTRLVRSLLDAGLLEAWLREQSTDPSRSRMPDRLLARAHPRMLRSIYLATGRLGGALELGLARRLVNSEVRPQDPSGASILNDFPDLCHPPVFGLDMYRVLAGAPIVLHHGLDNIGANAGALRLFEATGVGAPLLTDASTGLSSLFEVGEEVLAYRTPQECAGLLRDLRDDPATAGRIGAAGQRRTLRDHSTGARSIEWVDLVSGLR